MQRPWLVLAPPIVQSAGRAIASFRRGRRTVIPTAPAAREYTHIGSHAFYCDADGVPDAAFPAGRKSKMGRRRLKS